MDKSLFRHSQQDDLQLLVDKYKSMDIEKLEYRIADWEAKKHCSNQQQNLSILKKELKVKYKERQELIELLTKSLTSSSRMSRFISSIKAIFK